MGANELLTYTIRWTRSCCTITAWTMTNGIQREVGVLKGRHMTFPARFLIESIEVGIRYQPRVELMLVRAFEEKAKNQAVCEVIIDTPDVRQQFVLKQNGYRVVREPMGRHQAYRFRKMLWPDRPNQKRRSQKYRKIPR